MDILGVGISSGFGGVGTFGGQSLLGQILGGGQSFGLSGLTPQISTGGFSSALTLLQYQMAQQMLSVYSQLGSLWGGIGGSGFGNQFGLTQGMGPLGFGGFSGQTQGQAFNIEQMLASLGLYGANGVGTTGGSIPFFMQHASRSQAVLVAWP